ncbi:MAG TPA: phosphoglucomutase/phosphomannomutase family protein [Bacteroidota bacterium]|jgi:phosphomannomutase|nr:phosphoglucomutase/phosphomannomutase family protein [Bacteroidota bacterium]
MTTEIKFGTDGWRGKIAEDYTFDNVRRCTHGFAGYLKSICSTAQLAQGVVVGGDRRFNSEHFAAAAAEVLAGNGIPVHFCGGGVPTPVISFSVKARKAIGAINITASHNPPADNGFKVRDENGGAIDPDGLKKIEELIPRDVNSIRRTRFDDGVASGTIMKFNADEQYIEQIKTLVDFEPIRQAGLKILVDPMWGNGAGWFSRLIGGGKTQVFEIHSERNPSFPEMSRPEPIPPNIDAGLKKGKETGADVILITDGDADRCGIGDEHGQFIDQLRVYGLLALYLLEVRAQRGAIVKTLSTTSMLDALGKLYKVPVHETGVGFKYVAPKMMEADAMIGGEESGGYAFRNHVPERDGILANLFFLDFMVKTKKKPSELLKMLFDKVGAHYYDRIDTVIEANQKDEILRKLKANLPKRVDGQDVVGTNLSDGFKFLLSDGSWLLIRFSGTEPLVRVYSEAKSKEQVRAILQEGKKLVGG